MKLNGNAARRLAAAAITCTAILLPAAPASAGSAATTGSPASGAWRARPVTAYVVNSSSGTVTPIRTATNKAGRAINVKRYPYAIAITPNGKTAYVTNTLLNTVTPIQTATRAVGKAIKVGEAAQVIAITPNGKSAYVVNVASGTVTPISTATNKAGKAIKVGSSPGPSRSRRTGRPPTSSITAPAP